MESVFQLTSSSVQQFVKGENVPSVDLMLTEITRWVSIGFKGHWIKTTILNLGVYSVKGGEAGVRNAIRVSVMVILEQLHAFPL